MCPERYSNSLHYLFCTTSQYYLVLLLVASAESPTSSPYRGVRVYDATPYITYKCATLHHIQMCHPLAGKLLRSAVLRHECRCGRTSAANSAEYELNVSLFSRGAIVSADTTAAACCALRYSTVLHAVHYATVQYCMVHTLLCRAVLPCLSCMLHLQFIVCCAALLLSFAAHGVASIYSSSSYGSNREIQGRVV